MLEALKIDTQGCLDVTRKAARRFHERFAPPASIPCFSVAGDPPAHEVCWPLRRLHEVLFEIEGPNDGVVSVESANAFGRPLPQWPVDHLRQVNWLVRAVHGSVARPPLELHAEIVAHLASIGFGRRAEAEPPLISEAAALSPLALSSPIV